MPTKPAAKTSPKRNTAPAPPCPPPPIVSEPGGKLAALIALLRRPEGATLAALADTTGWKPQSVRGALAGALKARGHTVTSEKVDGVRTYRLPQLTSTPVRP